MKKRVFVSDIHMSTGLSLDSAHPYDWLTRDQAASFNQFLASISKDGFDELILVGDLLDDWVYPTGERPPLYSDIVDSPNMPVNRDIIDRLADMARDETRSVIYLAGNHDITITDASLEGFRKAYFPNIDFRQSYDSGDGVFAEHGNCYTIWNAPDPCKNALPIGHYISRLNANLDETASRPQRWQDALGHVLIDLIGANADVSVPLDYFARKLGMDEKTAPITTVEGGQITVERIKALYADLELRWKQGSHDFPGLLQQAMMEATPLGLDEIAPLTAKRKGAKVVIFGHTHWASLGDASSGDGTMEGPANFHRAVYANCGSWCTGQGGRQPQCGYVIDQYDDQAARTQVDGTHNVTLYYWANGSPQLRSFLTV